MRRFITALILVAAMSFAAPTARAQADLKLTRLSIKDPAINDIEAVSFLIPAGWKTDGGIQWFHDYSVLANLLMRITDPATGAQIEFLPIQNFTHLSNPVVPMQQGQNYMGSIVWQPIEDVPRMVQTFYAPQVLHHLQQAQPTRVENLDKLANEIMRNTGGQSKAVAQRVRYEFESNGQPWEEDVYLSLVYTPNQMGVFWSVNSAYSLRAPKGQLDRMTPLMATVVNTAQISKEWFSGYMYVRQLFDNRMNQGIRDAKALSDTITRNNAEISQMFSDAYRQRQESQDRINQSVSEYIRGVDTYKNAFDDRPVQLPAGYNDAWVNQRGEFILSNNGGFDPNVGDTNEWRRMNRRDEGGR